MVRHAFETLENWLVTQIRSKAREVHIESVLRVGAMTWVLQSITITVKFRLKRALRLCLVLSARVFDFPASELQSKLRRND